MEDDIPLHPVTGWIAEPIKAYDAVTLRFNFISSPMQDPANAMQTQFLLLTAPEAERLARKILSTCEWLKTAAFQEAPGPRH